MDDIVRDFLIESAENLDRLDQELVQLESDPASKNLLASIFRTIHTIKGSCGFLGFARLEKVAHAGESLLSKLRDGHLSLNAEITSGLLAMVDAVRRMLREIQATEKDGEDEYPKLQTRLKSLQNAESQVEESGAATKSPVPETLAEAPNGLRILEAQSPPPDSSETTPASSAVVAPESTSVDAAPQAAPSATQFRPSSSKLGGLLVERGHITAEELATALQEQEGGDQRRLGEILVALGLCRQEDINSAVQIVEGRSRNAAVETVRIGVDLLDTLMNLIGELVLARNQLLQASGATQDTPLQTVAQRMNLIVTEVQEQVMKTRMQPIANVWNKFPRTVRDLALNCGKEVHLEMVGQDTELDRTIIEAIKDPLTHLVRNGIDHGIETPEVRRQKGKDPAGRLTLRAFHEAGRVNIEISDDGAGLNVERLRSKAVERGLIPQQQASRMAEREIFNLIFLPGFSTAEKVTNVSGRGVGMDVVKTNVEKINGTVDIQSTLGKGTTVRVSLPLTLAIIPALVVKCRGERFAIPQLSVLELVGLANQGGGQAIEMVQGAPVYRLRGDLLPLVYLDQELGLSSLDAAASAATLSIVVLHTGIRQFGRVVDDILDTEEIVVKPLKGHLKGISSFAGATIMGDGRVALILDVLGLAQRARVVSEAADAREAAQSDAHAAAGNQIRQLLIARNGSDEQVAIPLSTVTRLEGFPASRVKHIGGQEVMEYRDKIIPLVRLSHVLPASEAEPAAPSASIELVIYSERGRTVGLIVDCIVDIIDDTATLDPMATRPGVVGSFVTQEHITEMLDLPVILRSVVSGLAEHMEAAAGA
jgi:two-component system chemotaxis sensor kinase CheA